MIVNYKGGKINVSVHHNQKAYCCYVLCKFKTTETQLLNEILRRFKFEKLNNVGTNINNLTQSIITTNNAVFASLAEKKVLSYISVLYKYILNIEIPRAITSRYITKKQSYKKLHDDITKGFDLYITGKCKILENKFASNHQQIKNFASVISATPKKARDDIDVNDKATERYVSFKIGKDSLIKTYFAIFCQPYDLYFDNENVLINSAQITEIAEYLKQSQKLAQTRIKTFLSQCGSLGTKPSANDKGGAKLKKRNTTILENINAIYEMFCELYNIPFKQMTKIEIDTETLAEMKRININVD